MTSTWTGPRITPAHEREEIFVATETSTKATLHQRVMHELKELAIISAYLYVTLAR
jgi:hypothetical protein